MKRKENQQFQHYQNSTSLFHKAKNGIDIAFQNISYRVRIPQKKNKYINLPGAKKYTEKVILSNLSGRFKAGKVSVIMGASGAGKTTLMNILACRIHHESQGKLFVNDIQYNYDSFGDFANYVMQTDLLIQTLTVRETLMFATDLKVNLSKKQKKHRVKILSDQLKLQKCLDTLVGGVTIKGISGGQKKRACIAFELITDPQVLFMDEPTSGLDSLTSYIIVSYMRRLSRKTNKTIIMTIHQPNSQTYHQFDQLLLLVEGKIVYQGNSQLVTQYFVQNFKLKCPTFSNPPDFFMSKIHHQSEENKKRYPIYFETYDSKIKSEIRHQIQCRQKTDIQFRKQQVKTIKIYEALLHRNLLNTLRNPMLMKAKVFQGIFLSLLAGGLFFRVGIKDFTKSQDWRYFTGCLFFISINALTTSLSPLTITFPLERPIFLKEQDSKMYSVLQYSISRFLMDIPELIIITLINVIILYFMIDLAKSVDQFFIFLLTYFLLGLAGGSLGLLIGSVILDAKSVAAVVPILLLPLMLFSGYFKNRNDLPKWIGWFQYISPIKYGFIGFTVNQVSNRDSLINELQFDLSLWPSLLILLGIGMAYRLLSVFFLYILRARTQ